MPVTSDKPAPYAPSTAIMAVVERFRQRGLPTPVDAGVLARASISESLIPRTLYALQSLDLIDESGNPTDVLEGLRLAPEVEYKARLGEWLTGAYADALQFIDPATATEIEIRDAFRNYRPHGQLDRMVTLFIGLFRAAGIAPEKASGGPPKKKVITLRMPARAATAVKPGNKPKDSGGGAFTPKQHNFDGALPPALAGLLASLPTHGEGWTKADRDAFMTTFAVVLDFVFPPGAVKVQKAEEAHEPDA